MKIINRILLLVGLFGLVGTSAAQGTSASDGSQTLTRLRENSGVTLQWIDWEQRGAVKVREVDGTVYLTGGQIDPNGPGSLWLDGEVIDAGEDFFIFEGLIRIANAPDRGRICEDTKRWRFAVTQNRKYWRLREFEWCDGLTDYVDIYF